MFSVCVTTCDTLIPDERDTRGALRDAHRNVGVLCRSACAVIDIPRVVDGHLVLVLTSGSWKVPSHNPSVVLKVK
jgi:hypothetical protein